MSLRIQIVSDLHVEFWDDNFKTSNIKPSAPILALLGDTCCVSSDEDFNRFKKFIGICINSYEHIIIVPGNHEYYYNPPNSRAKPNENNTMDACERKLKTLAKTNSKLHYLNNNTMDISINNVKYMIIGSVLWSWIPLERRTHIKNSMNDYQYIFVNDKKNNIIRNVTPDEIASLHLKNRKYITKKINDAKKNGYKVIVLTHHKPYLKPNHDPSTYDSAYESDLNILINKPVCLWGYGHTHIKDNRKINNVLVVSNPKGYPGQKTKFDKSFFIVL